MSSDDDIPLSFSSPALIGRTRLRKSELRRFLGELTRRVTRGRAMACLVTNDAELRRLNKAYRHKDYPTDVLSFPAAGSNGVAGDVAISIERARAQAAERGHSLEDELRILMLHGALHLAGMDHEKDSGEMARAEARWRRRLGLPFALLERSGK
jgi:probable rRNA maturation factor